MNRWMRVASVGVLALLASGCGEASQELSAEKGQVVVEMAEPAAAELLRTLVGRLSAALEEGGAAGAVEFCAGEALPLTRSVQANLEGGLELKRTSFRVRNPANAPDEAEREALLYFEEALEDGGRAPSSYVQQVSDTEYRYYKPLFVSDVCLQCHGSVDAMEPAVADRIREHYPEDLATGYTLGDFRGVVRVSVPAEAVEEDG